MDSDPSRSGLDGDDAPVLSTIPQGPDAVSYEIATVRQARSLATALAAHYPDPDRVVVGLTELLVNAVEHGNLGIGYAEKAALLDHGDLRGEIARRLALPALAARRVRVVLRREPDRLVTTIEDEGEGFDWKPFIEYDPERVLDANGHGIAIARGMSFDEVTYEGRGNVVVATVRLGPPGAAQGERAS